MIPVDARNNGNKYLGEEPDVCKPEVDYSQNQLGGSFGFEPSIDESNQSFMFDSTEVLRRARIYAAQEAYKERREKQKSEETEISSETETSSPLPEIEPVSGAMSNGVPFQSYSTNKSKKNTSRSHEAADMSVQDLESSISEYNLKDRMEVEVKLHEEKGVRGYRPHIPSIREELERDNSPIPSLELDECVTQRDIDLTLPNTTRSSRNDSEGTEMKEFSARSNRKPESILKDRRNSRDSPIDKISESALDHTDSPSIAHTSKKRIRFQDENWCDFDQAQFLFQFPACVSVFGHCSHWN